MKNNIGYLYLLTDKEENFSYIGISNNPSRRLSRRVWKK